MERRARKRDPACVCIYREWRIFGVNWQGSTSQQVWLSFDALLDTQQHRGVPRVKSWHGVVVTQSLGECIDVILLACTQQRLPDTRTHARTQRNVWTLNNLLVQLLPIHMFNGPFSGTTQMSQYKKGETYLDFTKEETVSGTVASDGPYASLHLAADR